ncbi:hypothetical protein M0638_19330 [Roseomonas sp. NAR14]|uniref:Uncharacterized protein n=1 Tax=Roseomonas acroporae TaxID=2937791 RepID=A0A9X1YCA0_9PROT|nr:hypothetical protein [Roseomonas acroporae]MCK8786533.1 hypothetical protein [Roseomonas acroporae]
MPAKPEGSPEEDEFAALRREVARSGKTTRSPLYRWMRTRRAAFAAFLAEESPTWAAVAAALASRGFTAADGGPINPETVRHVWWRVRRDAAAEARRKGRPLPGPAAPPPPPPLPAAAPEPRAAAPSFGLPLLDPEEPAADEPEFKPATLLGRARRRPTDGDAT